MQMLTAKEAAALMGVSRQTVYNWTSWGWLPCKYLGRNVRVSADDLNRMVTTLEQKQQVRQEQIRKRRMRVRS